MAAAQADSEGRAALGTGCEARTRRPWRTGVQGGWRKHSGVVASPSLARLQRPQRRGGHRATGPAQRGREEGAGQGPRSHEGASPSAAPVSAPAVRPSPDLRRPSCGSRTPGGVAGLRALPGPQPRPGPRLSAITPASRGPGRGGRAPVRLPHTWPGRGVSPQASNPGFGESGSEGEVGSSGFPRLSPESRPSLTVTSATVGAAAASRTGRG